MSTVYYEGYFKVTYYCKACKYPPGSIKTASGEIPEKDFTCAVDDSFFKKYKGCYVTLKNGGMYQIQDCHFHGPNILDIYNGDDDICDCKNRRDSGKTFYGQIWFD